MSEKQIILTVRATADGVYDNYLWKGPITSDEGYTPGEVFQVDATPFPQKDEKGNPVYELNDEGKKIPVLDGKGKQKVDDSGKKVWKIKMTTFFAKEWMERVEDDTELTYPDRPKWKIPEAYRVKKNKPTRTVDLPSDVKDTLAIPSSLAEAMGSEPQPSESVI